MSNLIAQIQLRRNAKSRWTLLNPILAEGEQGFEIDTGRVKIGNGVTAWRLLKYMDESSGGDASQTNLTDHINNPTPHPAYDDGVSLLLLYENAKV